MWSRLAYWYCHNISTGERFGTYFGRVKDIFVVSIVQGVPCRRVSGAIAVVRGHGGDEGDGEKEQQPNMNMDPVASLFLGSPRPPTLFYPVLPLYLAPVPLSVLIMVTAAIPHHLSSSLSHTNHNVYAPTASPGEAIDCARDKVPPLQVSQQVAQPQAPDSCQRCQRTGIGSACRCHFQDRQSAPVPAAQHDKLASVHVWSV